MVITDMKTEMNPTSKELTEEDITEDTMIRRESIVMHSASSSPAYSSSHTCGSLESSFTTKTKSRNSEAKLRRNGDATITGRRRGKKDKREDLFNHSHNFLQFPDHLTSSSTPSATMTKMSSRKLRCRLDHPQCNTPPPTSSAKATT